MEATLTKNNVQLIQEAFENFSKGNIPGIMESCADDIIWGSYNNPTVPYAGLFYGKEGVLEFFTNLGSNLNYTAFEPREFISQGDTVIVLGRHAGTVKKTGKSFDHDWAMHFKVKDGKVQKYFAFVDSLEQANAFKD